MQHEFSISVRDVRGKESQRQFAMRIGVTSQTVSDWERGLAVPRGIGVRRALQRAGVALPQVSTDGR